MAEYPKWIQASEGFALVVDGPDQEAAVKEGRAVIQETKSAQGSTYKIASVSPRPAKPKGK